tara:strand:+ start:37 stop:1695 length:1659 start_codon:yes stop_codon:yes gene_type:complete
MKTIQGFKTFLKEGTFEDAEGIIDSIGGGVMAEAIYETWAFIVAKLGGKTTVPTLAQIKDVLKDKEIVPIGSKWFKQHMKNKAFQKFIPQAIDLIGGDIKDIKGWKKWGSDVDVIHKSISDFYANLPDKYKQEGSKENTADMVLVSGGTAKDLVSAIKGADVSWDDNGIMKVGKIKFVQVSLKKGQDSARIGKLNTMINAMYGQQALSPSKLVGEGIEQFDEGILDALKSGFGKIADVIQSGVKKFMDWVGSKLEKLTNFAVKSINKAKSVVDKATLTKSTTNIMREIGMTLNESLDEAADDVVVTKSMAKEFGIFKKEIFGKDLVNKEYEAFVKNTAKINKSFKKSSKSKFNLIEINNKGTDPLLVLNTFKKQIAKIIKTKVGKKISRADLSPMLKITVNFASYRTFNTLLKDVSSQVDKYGSIDTALVALNGKLEAEAMFGNTMLPLYIVYGLGGGAHYKGTKDNYADLTTDKITQMGQSASSPYWIFEVAKSQNHGVQQEYNSIYLLLMVGMKEGKDKKLEPLYTKVQFINRSGSSFSYKIDAMNKVTL